MPMLDTVLLGLGHFQGNPDGFSKKKTWDVHEVISVDGSEIRANAPVEVGSSSLFIFTRFYTFQVVQNFFHQQYCHQCV